MRKFLSIIGLGLLALGLIIGAIILFASIPETKNTPTDLVIKAFGLQIGGGIAMLFGGISSAIFAIANFFKMKVRDAD